MASTPMQGPLDHIEASILEGLSAASGQPFLSWLVQFLSRTLSVRFAFVGRIRSDAWREVDTLVCARDGVLIDNFSYDLEGSPCAQVLSTDTCIFAHSVAPTFPADALLAEMGIEAYAGTPLLGSTGSPEGVLVVLHDAPFEGADLIVRMLERFSERAAVDVERVHEADRKQHMLAALTVPSDPAPFDSIARIAAEALRFRAAVITEVVGEETPVVHALACVVDGRVVAIEPHPLEDCALAETHFRDSYFCDDGLTMPDSEPLAKYGPFVSCLSEALLDSRGRRIGHLAVLHDQALHLNPRSAELLHVFALRVGSELEQRRLTETHRLQERRLLETQKMESLGVLAGGIAHDFNNLLVGILGNVSLARNEITSDSPVMGTIKAIETAAQRASDLSRQLLAYSGRGRFVIEPIDLSPMSREMVELLRVSLPKSARLRLRLRDGLPLVRADATQLRQVVMNLVLNGAEALEGSSGEVVLRTSLVRADEQILGAYHCRGPLAPGDFVLLEVTDTGCGMDDETLACIFEPFFTTKVEGRGLGLAAVEGIVRGHGGGLRVTSTIGRGTSVQILLPTTEASTAPTARPPSPPSDWTPAGTVLVVDDESIVRELVVHMLEFLKVASVAVPDGRSAVALVEAQPDAFSAVLLDLTMPEMDGRQTFEALRRAAPSLQVVLMSGYDERDTGRDFSDSTLAGFLQKPFRLEELRARLQAAMSD